MPDERQESMQRMEQHISNITPTLSELNDTLYGMKQLFQWSVEQHRQDEVQFREALLYFLDWSVEKQIQAQTETLDQLGTLLDGYHRADLLNQLTSIFASAEAVRQIKRLADQAEKIAGSVASIDENLQSVNERGDYFPQYIHSYVRMMIEKHSNEDVTHYFSVYNKGTQWHPKFAELQRVNPLGQRFLGHRSDLDELCAFLAEEVRPRVGQEAVLHILMPTIGQLAIAEAIKFPDEMHPCRVDGQLGNSGTPFVWMCIPERQDRACLRNIGVLKQRSVWVMLGAVGLGLPIIGEWLTVPTTPRFFLDPWYQTGTSVALVLVNGVYIPLGPEPPRTLGQLSSRPWD